MNPFERLQEWYWSHCDGDWEHDERIRIFTIDNPGWGITINVAGTPLGNTAFPNLEIERSDNDWYRCWREGTMFHAAGGPQNLTEIINAFIEGVDSNPKERRKELE